MVLKRRFDAGVVGDRGEQQDRAFLGGQILGMHERHVEKHALRPVEPPVVARHQGLARMGQGLCIGGVGLRPVAEQIARHLIKQDDQGKAAQGLARQTGVVALGRPMVMVFETGPDIGVERGVGLEPYVAEHGLARVVPHEPEIQNLFNHRRP